MNQGKSSSPVRAGSRVPDHFPEQGTRSPHSGNVRAADPDLALVVAGLPGPAWAITSPFLRLSLGGVGNVWPPLGALHLQFRLLDAVSSMRRTRNARFRAAVRNFYAFPPGPNHWSDIFSFLPNPVARIRGKPRPGSPGRPRAWQSIHGLLADSFCSKEPENETKKFSTLSHWWAANRLNSKADRMPLFCLPPMWTLLFLGVHFSCCQKPTLGAVHPADNWPFT